jgi:muconolactone D-isomerase
MIFHVRMDVQLPHDLAADAKADLLAREKAYAQELQRAGTWRHLWRIVGEYANYSVFDVESAEQLHQLLSGLPLFPYMKLHVTALCRHPSSIRDDDR